MEDDISIAGTPNIPGLRFRHFKPPEDYRNIVDIFNASSVIDDLDYTDTPEEVEKYYSDLANCDVRRDVLFAEMDGKPIGYSRVWYLTKSNGTGRIFQFFAAMKPEWRCRGIREAMLGWCEARVREITGRLPEGSSAEVILWVAEVETEWRGILERAGYETVRYGFRMVRRNLDDIPDCPLPEGIEVRPVTPDHYRKIWDADQDASQDGWLQIKAEEEWYRNWMSSRLFQPDLWQVAWEGDRVAGAV